MAYIIKENEPNLDGSETKPTFEVYLDGVVVFYAATETECQEWINNN
jgi:hypothetical protein